MGKSFILTYILTVFSMYYSTFIHLCSNFYYRSWTSWKCFKKVGYQIFFPPSWLAGVMQSFIVGFLMQNSSVEAIYNARKCIFCDIKFLNFLGGDTPEPPYGRGSRATPSRTHPRTTSGASRLRAPGGRTVGTHHPHQQFLDPPLHTTLFSDESQACSVITQHWYDFLMAPLVAKQVTMLYRWLFYRFSLTQKISRRL